MLPGGCRLFYSHREMRGAVVFLPIGSYEDHAGLPVVLDTLLALHVACRAAEYCGGLVAWPLGYGYSPLHRWSVSLEPGLLAELVSRLARGLLDVGAGRLVVVDGHYGHRSVVEEALEGLGSRVLYLNVWSLLEALGVRGFDRQLLFEREFVENPGGEAGRLVGEVARRVCQLVEQARGGAVLEPGLHRYL